MIADIAPTGAPTPMPGSYSAVGGFAFNPYDPRPDPRGTGRGGRGRTARAQHRRLELRRRRR